MKMPIPQDWDGETWRCVELRWPDSVHYTGILQGTITELARGRYWDESTGSVIDAQTIGRAIAEINLPLVPCDEGSGETVLIWRPASFHYRPARNTNSVGLAAGVNNVPVTVTAFNATNGAILEQDNGYYCKVPAGNYSYFVRFTVLGRELGRFRARIDRYRLNDLLTEFEFVESIWGHNANSMDGSNVTSQS
jgi:hypothetical protein